MVRAVDGDTLEVSLRGHRLVDVRMIGIDTPETKRPGTPIECGGVQASRAMHRLADNRRVTLVTDPSQDRFDRYGRLLAHVIRRGGRNLNKPVLQYHACGAVVSQSPPAVERYFFGFAYWMKGVLTPTWS